MPPEKPGNRAKKLWTDVNTEVTLDASGLTLLEDACRTVDIIDRLQGALGSKHQEWMRLSEEAEELAGGSVEVRIVINPLLGEIRQQRLALRQMIAHLKLGAAVPKTVNEKAKSIFDKLEEEFASPDS